VRNLLSLCFLWVEFRGGFVHLLDLRRRPLRTAFRGDNNRFIPNEVRNLLLNRRGQKTPSNFPHRTEETLRRFAPQGDTFWKGETPFPTFPQSLKVVFGWSWRRAMPSSINGHVERSETSPQLCFFGRVLRGSFSSPQLVEEGHFQALHSL